MSICLVQLSDLHLGRCFGGLGLPADLREELARASLDALRHACELAARHDAAALLIPGDLFDRPEVDEDLTARVRALFGDLARPVLVAPGNHDAFGPMSVWNNDALARLGLAPWPANVHIFATRRLAPRPLLDGALLVHGHRVEGYHTQAESPLSDFRIPPDARRHVLLIHGALAGPGPAARGTLPFTAAQLAATGAVYAAAGHYHSFRRIEHEGRLVGAYAGAAVPGSADEDPHGGVLVVRLAEGPPQVECVPVFPGRIARLTVHADPPLANLDDAAARVRSAAAAARLGEADIVRVTLEGFSQAEMDVEALGQLLRRDFRHVVVHDDTQPDAAAAGPAGGRETVESQFLASLAARIANCGDPHNRALLEAARRYGLAALRGRTLRPPPAGAADHGSRPGDAD